MPGQSLRECRLRPRRPMETLLQPRARYGGTWSQGIVEKMRSASTQGADASGARSVSQWERALLAQWFAGTERSGVLAVAAAYISERSHDDPLLRNKIIIAETARTDVAFLIHRLV